MTEEITSTGPERLASRSAAHVVGRRAGVELTGVVAAVADDHVVASDAVAAVDRRLRPASPLMTF
jgi:hypothetical protein